MSFLKGDSRRKFKEIQSVMYARLFSARSWLIAVAAALALLVLPVMAFARANAGVGFYQQTNLTSNLPGIASFTDPNLTNPWGISSAPGGPFWISDNGSGKSTLYDNNGTPQSLVVSIPSSVRRVAGGTTRPRSYKSR